jgi:hypothetical protein
MTWPFDQPVLVVCLFKNLRWTGVGPRRFPTRASSPTASRAVHAAASPYNCHHANGQAAGCQEGDRGGLRNGLRVAGEGEGLREPLERTREHREHGHRIGEPEDARCETLGQIDRVATLRGADEGVVESEVVSAKSSHACERVLVGATLVGRSELVEIQGEVVDLLIEDD